MILQPSTRDLITGLADRGPGTARECYDGRPKNLANFEGEPSDLMQINAVLRLLSKLIYRLPPIQQVREGAMLQQLHAAKICGIDLFFRRMVHIGLDPSRLKPDQLDILGEIRERCPTCEDPARCAADLAGAAPEPGWGDWDEYCPNAARLRILAALSMFSDDAAEEKNDVCHAARIANSDDKGAA